MRHEDFQASMGRIAALFPFRDDADKAAYFSVIFEAVGSLDAAQFDETVKAVAQGLTAKARRPVPQAYLDAHKRLSEAKGWYKMGAKLRSCQECGGSRFHVVYYRVISTGVPYSGLEPCGYCSPTVAPSMDAKPQVAVERLTKVQYEQAMAEIRKEKTA